MGTMGRLGSAEASWAGGDNEGARHPVVVAGDRLAVEGMPVLAAVQESPELTARMEHRSRKEAAALLTAQTPCKEPAALLMTPTPCKQAPALLIAPTPSTATPTRMIKSVGMIVPHSLNAMGVTPRT